MRGRLRTKTTIDLKLSWDKKTIILKNQKHKSKEIPPQIIDKARITKKKSILSGEKSAAAK